LYPQQNEYSAGHTNGKSGNIDQRKSFVAQQVAKRNFEIILKHDWRLSCWLKRHDGVLTGLNFF
jgi:hypothetical protein